ncbi:MAG: DHH family phosphoesterase [Desulfobulbaceae bacterium]|jgi:single-stranded-DNA-specific exonuclease|nr:DHH family phosphoesterase [Desulfobulbaceae bacterium]
MTPIDAGKRIDRMAGVFSYDAVVFLDCETSGLDADKHQIIELAAIRWRKGAEDSFDDYIKLPENVRLDPEITKITGISEDELRKKGVDEPVAAQKLIDFLLGQSPTLVIAYNCHFVGQFIIRMLQRQGQDITKDISFLDMLTLWKDRNRFSHKLPVRLRLYPALNAVKYEVERLHDMRQERDDVAHYINLFGYDPEYGVKGTKIPGVRYLPQPYRNRYRNGSKMATLAEVLYARQQAAPVAPNQTIRTTTDSLPKVHTKNATPSAFPQIPPFFEKILNDKGLNNPEQIRRFLYPRLENLPHPKEILNMAAAAEAVLDAVSRHVPIILWGDYDVDGVTGVALLHLFFQAVGVSVRWYIPDRFIDGYGVSLAAFERQFGAEFPELESEEQKEKFLFITIDCGISDQAALAAISRRGGRVIVSDHHHLPAGRLPPGIIINPQQKDCGLCGQGLAGVGVAFYLAAAARALMRERGEFATATKQEPDLHMLLPLVAIGTLADVSLISKTNRILVRAGLERLHNSPLPGLRALLRATGIQANRDQSNRQRKAGRGHSHRDCITSEDVGFAIGPLLNAAGRLRHADLAARLLISADQQQAEKTSRKLLAINNERKSICEENTELALRLLPPVHILDQQKTLVLVGAFHPGVAGIVAAKMVEKTGKATFVLAQPNPDDAAAAMWKGSGRSVPGVHLADCLKRCADLLEHHGGHAMAAGLSLKAGNIANFAEAFEEAARTLGTTPVTTAIHPYKVSVEAVMRPEHLRFLSLLEPYGQGNPPPVFQSEEELVFVRALGSRGEHLQALLRGRDGNHRAVGFRLGDRLPELRERGRCLVTFAPILNRYRDTVSWQVRLLDIRAVEHDTK